MGNRNDRNEQNSGTSGTSHRDAASDFHNKIIWFSFAFSLLVIWIHAYNAELYLGKTVEMDLVYRLEHRIGDWLGQIAVPGFFMISGYLFYREFTWEKLGGKWKKRIRSVLVPYIVWNFLYYGGYVIASRLPWLDQVVGKGVIPFRLDVAVDAVIHYTYNYVFWYLFQLILLILLAPVLYLFLKNFWSRCLFLAVAAGFVVADVRLPLLNADALLYYGMAAAVALSERGRRIVERQKPAQVSDDADFLLVGCVLLAAAACFYRQGMRLAWPAGLVACRLFSVAGWWLVIPAWRLPEARSWMNHNFFLYAVHFALVRFLNKAGATLLPPTAAVPLLLYLFMPVLVLGIAGLFGRMIRKLSPVIWSVLNGGRT